MEYEVKFKLDEIKSVLSKLKELKAKDLGEETQVDVYFGLGNKAVRLRQTGKTGCLATLKRLVLGETRAKIREEIETEVGDMKSLTTILEEFDFREVKRKEKIRHTFQLDKMFVLIDRLPFMGYYVELEATSEAALKKMTKKLGFDYNQAIGDSYDDLFFKYYIKNAKRFQTTQTKIIPIFKNEEEYLREQE